MTLSAYSGLGAQIVLQKPRVESALLMKISQIVSVGIIGASPPLTSFIHVGVRNFSWQRFNDNMDGYEA